MKSKNIITIVANGAGGAELLSSYILTKSNSNYLYFLKGPAKKIFNLKINKIDLNYFYVTKSKTFFTRPIA